MKVVRKRIQYLLIVLIMLVGSPVFAQLPGFDDNVDDEGITAPIDGFVGLAFLAGIVFGVKKLKGKKEE